jgi:hypothetical protein
MQGESLSPFLYALYVNDIEIELIKQGCQSYELKMLNLYLLMYVDDTVLLSENVHELQNMINVVNVCSNEYNLHVNLLKTKVVIFFLEIEVILNQKKNGILMGNPLKYVMNLCTLVFC